MPQFKQTPCISYTVMAQPTDIVAPFQQIQWLNKATASGPPMGPTQPPIQWVPADFPEVKAAGA
jgi:hypothetical protein